MELKRSGTQREIKLENGVPENTSLPSNRVSTGSHSLHGFFLSTLLMQFTRLSSLWFILVALIGLNPLGMNYPPSPVPVTLLLVHLAIAMARDGFALARRNISDRRLNKEQFSVWTGDKFMQTPCQDLKVGQCLLLPNKARVPADVILLATSAQDGSAYISTFNILGESNLDVKHAVKELQRRLPNNESPLSFHFHRLKAVVRVNQPTADYSAFQGRLKVPGFVLSSILELQHFVLRGSVVYSTAWVLCMVVYTGMETKVWLDRAQAPRKISKFLKLLNYWTLYSACAILLLSAILLLVQHLSSQESVLGEDFILYIWVLSSEVPVALYIALDIVRLVLMWKFSRRNSGSFFKFGTMPEDLAKVSYVLMDKTGTLTENELELSEVVIQDDIYSKTLDLRHIVTSENTNRMETLPILPTPREHTISEYTFSDLKEKMRLSSDLSYRSFCECITLCNSVVPGGKKVFKATSADEKAIVQAARDLGCNFLTRVDDICLVDMFGVAMNYQVLAIRKFSPELRRMRVLVKNEYNAYATLYVKGAYAVLRDFLSLGEDERKRLESRLEDMTHRGLRTMLLCFKQVAGDQLEAVVTQARNIYLSKTNIEAKLEILLKDLEKEMRYIGIAGIREEVRSETRDCLEALNKSKVELMVLSGDSENNTLASAYSLGLLDSYSKVVSLRGIHSTEICAKRLFAVAKEQLFHADPAKLQVDQSRPYFQSSSLNWTEFNPESVNFALSIDGVTLTTALREKITKHFLICLLCGASFTCFNTLNPTHKRDVVKLLKTGLRTTPTILTIGDDGSNVPMLLEADVGVGIISRKRDNRAALNSDVAVRHFTVLRELLAKGKRNAEFLSRTTLLFLYSTTVQGLLKLAFMLAADATPSFLFSIEMSIFYNTAIALVPFVYLGVTEDPEHYTSQRKVQDLLSLENLLMYLILALVHAVGILGSVVPGCYEGSASIISTSELTLICLLSLVLTVNQHCIQESHRPSVLPCIGIGLGLTFLYLEVIEADYSGAVLRFFSSPRLMAAVGLATLVNAVVSVLFLRKREERKRRWRAKVLPFRTSKSFIRKLRSESKHAIEVYHSTITHAAVKEQVDINFALDYKQMKFVSQMVESNYIQDFTTSNLLLIRVTLFLSCVQLVITLPETAEHESSVLPFLAFGCSAGAGLLVSTWLHQKVIVVLQWFAVAFVLLTFIMCLTVQKLFELVYFSVPVGLLLIVKEKWVFSCLVSTVAFILLLIDIVVNYTRQHTDNSFARVTEAVGTILVQLLVTLISVRVAYDCNRNSRTEYRVLKEAEDKVTQSDNILSCLLPDFVRKRVKDGLRYIAEDKDNVTVLFCEVCDFDEISMAYGPRELIELLDDVFQKIDDLCDAMGVAKIETVGKVYMACTGLADFESEVPTDIQLIPHCQRAIELAVAILSSFRLYKLLTGKPLRFKIGINTGPVIAGVVGYHKPQFSLVGDTVNTASRMCTTVDTPNTIQLSSSTYQSLSVGAASAFTTRKVFVKGKGEMTAYLLDAVLYYESLSPRKRTGSTVEEPHSSFSRVSTRQRSSIGTALRHSVDYDDVIVKHDKELIEKVRVLPSCTSEPDSEKSFRLYIARRKFNRVALGLGSYLVSFGVLGVLTWVQAGVMWEGGYICPAVLYSASWLLILYIRVRLTDNYTKRWFSWCLILIYTVTALSIYLELALDLSLAAELATLMICLLLIIMYYCSGIFFRHSLIGSAVVVVPWVAVCVYSQPERWERSVFTVLFALQHCVYMYFNEKNQRTFFNLSKLASREIEKTERLLTQMLPVHAYERLKQDEWVTDRLLQVTVLYADIAGFTAWSSSHTPQEVINHLSQIYTAFDKICVRLGVYKVHTIGDCYVAMSATSNSDQRDPAEECQVMLSFAEEMVKVLSTYYSSDSVKLSMRIGLHLGDVVAGITGTKVIRYDVYGSDILIANKMESNSAEGRINVSSVVREVLESRIAGFVEFERNKTVEIKELNKAVDCYFVRTRE